MKPVDLTSKYVFSIKFKMDKKNIFTFKINEERKAWPLNINIVVSVTFKGDD